MAAAQEKPDLENSLTPEQEAALKRIEQSKQRDPLVDAIKDSKPETPAETLRLATLMADLGRADLAKKHLQAVLASDLDQDALVALADELTQVYFSRLAARKDLAPEGRKLADAVLSAVKQRSEATASVEQLVQGLSAEDERTRDEAVVGLRKAGEAAISPLMAVLADPARAAEHKRVRAVLVSMAGDATRPLLAYLDSSNPKLVVQVIDIFTAARARDSLVWLLAPYASPDSPAQVRAAAGNALKTMVGALPTGREASRILTERAQRYLDGKAGMKRDENGMVTLWQWNAKDQRAEAKTYSLVAARAELASRLAGDALAVDPANEKVRRLFLLATLEAAAYEAGLDEAVVVGPGTRVARAAEFGPEALLKVLDEAMRTGHGSAAAAAAQVLGQAATARQALSTSSKPSPLARALRSSDRRTRTAAVEAIVRLKPTEPFAGSSYLPEAMAFLASSKGERRAMVAARNTAEARRIGGFLADMGYEIDTAVTGHELLKKLAESSDYELVLVDVRIDRPPIGILLQQLSQDGRTARLPVGVIGAEGFFKQSEKAARDEPMAIALVRPHSRKTVEWQLKRLEALIPTTRVSAELRKKQAVRTLAQLAELAETSRKLFDLSVVEKAALGAAWSPALSGDAVNLLEKLGTPESQKALADLASNPHQSLETRKAALKGLTHSIEKNGILLTTGEILRQYDLYNASAKADKATQQILGLILDAFEANRSGQ
jgi:hypothetical protein